MPKEPIIQAPEFTGTVTVLSEGEELKKQLLDLSTPIKTIADADHRDQAIKIAANIKGHLKRVEEARVEVKEPYLKMGKAIDAAAKDHAKALDAELERLNRLIAGFEQERIRKEQEEARARQAELERLKREADQAEKDRQEKLNLVENPKPGDGAADMCDELDADLAAQQAEEAKKKLEQAQRAVPVPAIAKATGGSMRQEIDLEITDMAALYKAHPGLVKLTADIAAIKFFIRTMEERNGGNPVAIAGLTYTKRAAFSARGA